jgi:excisionase family DNA binding protein
MSALISSHKAIQPDQLLSLAEAASFSGLSHSHLRTLANQKKLWSIKKGKSWLTTKTALRQYLKNAPKPGPKRKI